jgi:hypothetical protein
MLLCTEIITYWISYVADDLEKKKPVVLVHLKHNANGTLYLNYNSHWRLIPLKEAIRE